ncbi:hypothetical protein ACFOYW_08315 [Gryllotalpicola reticulitermitis]|uniref:HNH endonuclease n=1 Tax=Gryllotalpicola reticulitermitis TaxID=1184153 RepID=A0ABV8Q4T3_9MICO
MSLFPRREPRSRPASRSRRRCRDCGGFIEARTPTTKYISTQAELLLDSEKAGNGDVREVKSMVDANRTFILGQCATCRAVADRAKHLVAEHEVFALRLGTLSYAEDLFTSGLLALDLLGVPAATADAAFTSAGAKKAVGLLVRGDVGLAHAGADARYLGRLYPIFTIRGQRQGGDGTRWSHLASAEVDAVREGYLAWQKLRVERTQPIPAPEGGCMFCGIGAVMGLASQGASIWGNERKIDSRTLGGPGLGTITGHLCPVCRKSVEMAGAFGAQTLTRALLDYVGYKRNVWAGYPEAEGLQAWAVTRRGRDGMANPTPWAHEKALAEARRWAASASKTAPGALVWDDEHGARPAVA